MTQPLKKQACVPNNEYLTLAGVTVFLEQMRNETEKHISDAQCEKANDDANSKNRINLKPVEYCIYILFLLKFHRHCLIILFKTHSC